MAPEILRQAGRGMRPLPWTPPSSFRDAPLALAQAPRSSFRGAPRSWREPGIHPTAILAAPWIPGSRRFTSRPGMTKMICPTGKSAKSCLAQVAKIYRFAFDPKHLYKRAVSCPLRGAYHGRRETLARDAMDAGGIEDERYRCGRQSRVVLAPDAGVKFAGSNPQATVANKLDHRGERGISRKPLRRGCPGASAEPVCSCAPFSLCV
jgi:hypothetical protein